ncbi:MAG: filamentous hemagglutinin N-terminal domain-containing protein [Nitrospira sp.]|nr:filamentous hemagglutinin N-terminal domain-containing protein [Nitrospira sp.]
MAYALNASVTTLRLDPSITGWVIGAFFYATALHVSAAFAQMSTPPITSSGLNTQISAPMSVGGKTHYDITGGTRIDTNLFHSFGDFSVPNNNIANFLNNTGLVTDNILTRVTSGNASNIFGTIQTTGFGDANLFLMNPAGIIFGPTAALNVGGSATFTTADYVRLTSIDGRAGLFHANPAMPSVLTSAPVAAFGFLDPNPASISLQGSNLEVQPGKSIAVVGGNVTVESGTLGNIANLPPPSTQGKQVYIASVASPGEILAGTLDPAPNINGQSFSELGAIRVEQSIIDTSGAGGGTVLIRGGQFVLSNSTISSKITGPGNLTNGAESLGGGINILASQDVIIQDGSAIETKVTGNTTPGTTYGGVHVNANRITILGIPGSSPESPQITSIKSDTEGSGNAGNIILHATGNIEITNLVNLASISRLNSTGNSGNVELSSAQGNIQITENVFTQVTSQTFNNSSGTTGKVIASAPAGDIVLDGANFFTSASPKSGGGGQVEITAKNLRITNTGLLSADNDSQFKPNGITITLSGELEIAGGFITTSSVNDIPAGDISLNARDIVVTQGTIINSATFASGSGGHLKIVADTLQVRTGAQLSSGSTRAPNRGSLPQNINPSGRGGDITIQTLGPRGSILIDGQGSGIFADTEGIGVGGNISLVAGKSIVVSNGGAISASSTGSNSGDAGKLSINAGQQLDLLDHSSITTTTQSPQANGGDIDIRAIDRVRLVDSTISTSVKGAEGSGGNIFIDPKVVMLEGSNVTSQAVGGAGGNITLVTPLFLADSASLISASSQRGVSGTVTIQSPTSNLSGTVGQLVSKMSPPQVLLQNRCMALAGGEQSTFLLAGRDTLPTEPDGWLNSPVSMEHLTGESTEQASSLKVRSKSLNRLSAMTEKKDNTNILSLRQLTPPGFLVLTFATGSTGCPS